MRKRVLVVCVSLVLIFSFIVIGVDHLPPARGITITVDDSGGEDFEKIQDAINASSDGDTVFVYNGLYNERIQVNRSINLTGEDKDNTIINGTGSGDVIKVTSNWVNVTGFTINHGGDTNAGMNLYFVHNCSIFYNIFSFNNYDLKLYNCSDISIMNNSILDRGIELRFSHRNIINNNNGSTDLSYITTYYSHYNKIINNRNISLYLRYSKGYEVINNEMNSRGISIEGDRIEHWNTHIIENSNIINNLPILYIKNQTGGVIPNGGAQIILANCTNVRIENQNITDGYSSILLGFCDNNTVSGNNISSGVFGILLSYSNGNLITNNNVSNQGCGLRVSYSKWNTISNNEAFNNSDGFSISGEYNFIYNNTIVSNTYIGISNYGSNNSFWENIISYNGNGFRCSSGMKNKIYNNTITHNGIEQLLTDGYGLYFYSTSDNEVFNNTISFNGLSFSIYGIGIGLRQCNNNSIHHNDFITNYVNGLSLGSSSGNHIFDNYFYDNFANGIVLNSCSNNTLENNTFVFESYGIGIYGSDNNTIINNGIGSHPGDGISLNSGSDYNIISGNGIGDCYNGIIVDSSTFNTIDNNSILSNYGSGLVLVSDSHNNSITDNSIYDNDLNGIRINTNGNLIRSNLLFSNLDYGVSVENSYDNEIYHNHFEDNGAPAHDNTNSGNQWDNGYPSGGNYWSNYNGLDLYSGPNQDILGNDGIGDIEYNIDSDSVDNYPLMGEIGEHVFLFKGWNLISNPFLQPDTNLSTVLSPIAGSYDAVQWYDKNDLNDHWKHHNIDKSPDLNDLESINHTMGFLIYITDSPGIVYEFPGASQLENQTIPLDKGWNLVGYPSLGKYNLTSGLNNLEFGFEVDAIQWFNASSKTWHFMSPSDHFIPGRGYWIHSLVETIWEVPL